MIIYFIIAGLTLISCFNPILFIIVNISYVWIIVLSWFFLKVLALGVYRYFLCGLVLSVVVNSIVYRRSILPKWESGIILSFLLAFIMIVSSVFSYGASHEFSKSVNKISLFVFGNLGVYYCTAIFFQKKGSISQFCKIYIVMSILIAIIYFILFISGKGIITDRFLIAREVANPIAIGRYFGCALIVTMYSFLGDSSRLIKFFFIIVMMIFIIAMALTGSKGPFVAAVMISFAYFCLYKLRIGDYFNDLSRSIIVLYLVIGSLCLMGVIVFQFVPQGISERFYGSSYQTRLEIWPIAFDLLKQYPLGIGSGMFEIVALQKYQVSIRYPHNIFLEIFIENGWLAGIVFILFIVCFLKKIAKVFFADVYNNDLTVAGFLFLFAFLTSLVSGDISNNRDIWVFGGMFVGGYEYFIKA